MMWIPSLLSQAATFLPYLPLFVSRNPTAHLDPPADPRFPVPHPSLSYWLQSVRNDPLLDCRTTEDLPRTSDVVVIGSGVSSLPHIAARISSSLGVEPIVWQLAGSLIAYSLLHSDSANTPTSVTLLEAREFCSGATGRCDSAPADNVNNLLIRNVARGQKRRSLQTRSSKGVSLLSTLISNLKTIFTLIPVSRLP